MAEAITAQPPSPSASAIATVNINVGVLGHVDSGKTSLVKALSTLLSTAALDKNPQSRERGITLDLGFSAFVIDAPEAIKSQGVFTHVQYTLVDCPGHASLIRTIIGGAQIIDRMLLVIDVTKGIQTQTAECLVIGDILTNDLTVVLNKVDLIPPLERQKVIEQTTKVVRKALAGTRFANAHVIAIAAHVGGSGKVGAGGAAATITSTAAPKHDTDEELAVDTINRLTVEDPKGAVGLKDLIAHLQSTTIVPQRNPDGPLLFSVDHCFNIKGQGTVLTGTVLCGSVGVGQVVELPELKLERKVKSIQMFRRPVDRAEQGDRAALCVTNLSAKQIERGIVAAPQSMKSIKGAVVLVRKVRYFGFGCDSGSRVHVTVGHTTVMAKVTFFGSNELGELAKEAQGKNIPVDATFDQEKAWTFDTALRGGGKAVGGPFLQWCLLTFDAPVVCTADSMMIASRLDVDVHTRSCRIAFYGRLVRPIYAQDAAEYKAEVASVLRVYKQKERTGVIDRIVTSKDKRTYEVIAKSMFKKETDLSKFIGLPVWTVPRIRGGQDGAKADTSSAAATGASAEENATQQQEDRGVIEGSFGKTGKFKVAFAKGTDAGPGDRIVLKLLKSVFESTQPDKLLAA